ncbi:MAG: hypothetical protein IPG94_04860 [Kineosporiaceae bacterium]|nr:hypothetical protein [Kineosporiaceae bacterium]
MTDLDNSLVLKFERSRPSLNLICIEDGALPFSWAMLDVLAQERKPLPLLDEFVLRSLEAGLQGEVDISLLLGLDEELVSGTVATLMQRDYVVRRQAADGRWRVTPLLSAQVLLESCPQLRQSMCSSALHSIVLDGPLPFKRSDLVSDRDAKDRGLRLLPGRPDELTDTDFAAPALNRLLSEQDDDNGRVEILSVRKVSQRARLYLPVKLLVYADDSAKEVQIGVAIDGELSRSHELEIERIGGAQALGIIVETPASAPLEELPSAVLARRVSAAEVQSLRLARPTSRVGQVSVDSFASETDSPDASTAAEELAGLEVRSVGVHEHRGLLIEALQKAERRILIIAPWVKRAVVDTEFLALLERRLRRGVMVTIAHGYGSDDRGSDESSLRSLTNLQSRFQSTSILHDWRIPTQRSSYGTTNGW